VVFPQFNEIVLFDFEFGSDDGDRPRPVCLVAHELRSGRKHRLWRDQFGPMPPYPMGPETLFVAYYASAEISCHLALGWPVPPRVLDLFVEFRCLTNGRPTRSNSSLAGALIHLGLDALDVAEKKEMRELAIELGRTGRPASDDERTALLAYCEGDVDALARLLPVTALRVDLPRALLRGRYMAAAARIEANGVPIDSEMLARLRAGWSDIQDRLIAEIDRDYGVFEGRTFKHAKFEQWLIRTGTPWPRLPSGQLDLGDDTFRERAKSCPAVAPLRELRASLAELRLNNLAVGRDGRNRAMLSAFRSKTSRNQPSNSKFVFGPSTWIRGLIKPPPGHAVAYLDYEQQEFGIAAALSGDPAMLDAYRSGDPYLAFAKQAGAVPPDATKETHEAVRDLYKATVLGIQYGMGEEGLALRIGGPPILARNLLAAHRQVYRRFWQWSDAAVDFAVLTGRIHTVFGWAQQVDAGYNARSLRNFPMQANGAEMLRLACCLATERGIEVCAPVHDALLICAPLDRIETDVATACAAMAEASRAVLAGFELRTEAKVVRWPDRYMDKRGKQMWDTVSQLVHTTDQIREAAE
jgi:DNA polymerase I